MAVGEDLDLESQMAALAQGDSLASILVPQLSHSERAALDALALTRWFDPAIAERLLGSDASAIVTALLDGGFVREIPLMPGRMRVAPDVATFVLPAHVDSVRKVRELSRNLAEIYAERREQMEELYHLLVGDPVNALGRFEEAFAKAYGRSDLAACRSIVDVLEDPLRIRLLDHDRRTQVQELSTRLAGYVAAREQWAAEFHRSARHFAGQGMTEEWEALLAPEPPRLLQLYSTGGMGKTSQIEWLIARRCPPSSIDVSGIPSARVDFDFVNLAAVREAPWLLLVELARQLDRQTAGWSFGKLLADYQHQLPALRRGAAVEVGELTMPDGARNAIGKRFQSAVRALPEQTVLVVFDTLEVAVESRTDIAGILATLLEVLDLEADDEAPKLRVVLSGRRDLRNDVPGLRPRLQQGNNVELPPFTDREAGRFVSLLIPTETESPRDEIIAAIVRQSGGIPLKLRLFSDIVLGSPDRITAREIDEIKDPDILYLVERVIERIADPEVRWLVRYGVIPRTLTYDSLQEIVYPFIKDALAGDLSLDDMEESAPQVREAFTKRLHPGTYAIDDNALLSWWKTLKGYAAGYAWVSLDAAGGDAVRFHPEVLEPMRYTLRNQPVAERLHRRAIAYFDRAARTDPTRWCTFQKEAIYHRFQVGSSDAAEIWSKAIARSRREGNDEVRRDLAKDLLSRDYVQDGLESRRRGDCVILHKRVIARALYHLADAAIELAHRREAGRGDSDWADARWAVAELDDLNEGLKRPLIPTARLLRVKAAVAAHDGDPSQAGVLLEQAMDKAYAAEDRLAIQRTRAAIARPGTGRMGLDLLSTVVDLAESGRQRIPLARTVEVWGRAQLAHGLESDEKLDEALRHVRQAKGALSAKNVQRRVELLIQESRLLAKIGATAPAATLAAEALKLSPDHKTKADATVAEMRALNWQGKPLDALGVGRDALQTLGNARDRRQMVARAILLEALGLSAAYVYDFGAALAAWSEAVALWEAARGPRRTEEPRLRIARLQLRHIGDVNAAAQLLSEMEGSGSRVLRDLLGLEIAVRRGEVDLTAVESIARSNTAPVWLRLEAAMVGLEISTVDAAETFAAALVAALQEVQPTSRRATIMLAFTRVPGLGTRRPQKRRTLAALERRGNERIRGVDRALIQLGFAELARVLGDKDRAEARLAGIDPGGLVGPHLVWRWLMTSFQVANERDERWEALIAQALGKGPTPALYSGSLLLRFAQCLANLGYLEEAAETLRSATERLDELPPTIWHSSAIQLDASLASQMGDEATHSTRLQSLLGVEQILGRDASAAQVEEELDLPVVAPRPPAMPHTTALSFSPSKQVLETADDASGALPEDARTIIEAITLVHESDITGAATFVTEKRRPLEIELSRVSESFPADGLLAMEGEINALPWELGGVEVTRVDSAARALLRRVESIQVLLNSLNRDKPLVVDGTLGPATRKALVKHQQKLGIRTTGLPDAATSTSIFNDVGAIRREQNGAPEVVFVSSEYGSGPTLKQLHSVDLSWLFAEKGLRLVAPHESVDELSFLDEIAVPSLVYAVAGFGVRGKRVELLLGGDHSNPWPISALYGVLRRARAVGMDAPVVVLDVPWPGNDLEVVRQLLLRNLYAADLFASGGVSAVLATGLFPPNSFVVYESLATLLGGDRPLGQIVAELNQEVLRQLPTGPEGLWSYSALFSAAPELGIPLQARKA